MSLLRFASALALTAPVVLIACSDGGNSTASTSTGTSTFTTGSAGGTAGSGGATSSSSGDLFDAGPGSGSTTSGTGGAGGSHLIYASTDTDLYTLDPTDPALALKHVGTFDCIGPSGTPNQQSTAMTDIAVDAAENIWGLSVFGVRKLTVQGTTVHCDQPIQLHVPDPTSTNPNTPWIRFYALAFAPAGIIKPNEEILVAGDTTGSLWAIDPSSSTPVVQRGSFGTVPADDGRGHAYPATNVGKPWELSGDIIFLANNGSPVGFATVRDCPNPPDTANCSKIDTLIEIDMAALAQPGTQSVRKGIRGQIVKAAGCTDSNSGYGSMYGIASWNDKVYGFSRTGNLVNISNDDGSACLVQNYASQSINFSGAAVTTLAPVVAPPPPPVK